MKCHECEKEAVWLVEDLAPYDDLFFALCEEHFQELREMEGEMNLDFSLIANLTLDEIIKKANGKWKYLSIKYSQTLKLYSEANKVFGNEAIRKEEETLKTISSQKKRIVAVCPNCGLEYFKIPPDGKCNGSYPNGVCKAVLKMVEK